MAVVFHHDPLTRPAGVDLVRLEAITSGLIKAGLEAEIIAPVQAEARWKNDLLVRPPQALAKGGYDLVKTSYHQSIRLIRDFAGPVVSRLVRIVDEKKPRHDENQRAELLACQALVAERASAVATNNEENRQRWLELYGQGQEVVLTPTGTTAEPPLPGPSPYRPGPAPLLFLGTVSAPGQARMLNHLARALKGRVAIHHLGANKTGLYGDHLPLDPAVVPLGRVEESRLWDYLYHAALGLILTYGPDRFENDIAKTYNYLRAGLPIVFERPIIQDSLIESLAMGRGFDHGSPQALVRAVESILADPPAAETRRRAGRTLALEHSWARRVAVYVDLFRRLAK